MKLVWKWDLSGVVFFLGGGWNVDPGTHCELSLKGAELFNNHILKVKISLNYKYTIHLYPWFIQNQEIDLKMKRR